MFKIGNKVVLVSNRINAGKHNGIYVNHTYTISDTYIYSDNLELYISLEETSNCSMYYHSKFFMSVSDYRKRKLKKINDKLQKI